MYPSCHHTVLGTALSPLVPDSPSDGVFVPSSSSSRNQAGNPPGNASLLCKKSLFRSSRAAALVLGRVQQQSHQPAQMVPAPRSIPRNTPQALAQEAITAGGGEGWNKSVQRFPRCFPSSGTHSSSQAMTHGRPREHEGGRCWGWARGSAPSRLVGMLGQVNGAAAWVLRPGNG